MYILFFHKIISSFNKFTLIHDFSSFINNKYTIIEFF